MTAGDFWPVTGPARPGERPSAGGSLDRAVRERILDSTERLVRQIGISKTSMSDVARDAGVGRATLYRYFESRDVLFDVVVQRATDRFFAEVDAAMGRHATLSGQLGEFSQMMIRSIHPGASGPDNNRATMVRLLATQSAQALRRTSRFLVPYITEARERGEVRRDLDIADASEWLARVLLSFTVFQAAISYEPSDPLSVSSFVRRYAISGLATG